MIIDGMFRFCTTAQVLSGTTAVASTNVLDEGSAKLLFGGFSERPPKIFFDLLWVSTAGGTPSIRAQLVAASAATLDADVEVLADTGIVLNADDGTAFGTGHVQAYRLLSVRGQKTAAQFYGCLFTQAGTTPVFNVKAFLVADGQTYMPAKRAAVPA